MREKQIAGEDRSISAQPPSPAFDLNLFRVFSAVYRLGSQGQAARALQLSQPAVSHALARLREQLGGPLFTRVGQGAVPTPLAHAIVRDVDQALQLLGQTVAAARGFSPATSRRRFRVGTGDALEQALVVEIFIAVAKLAPAVALDSVPCGPEEIPELIVAGEIDIGLGVPVPHGDRVCHRVVAREPVLLAMRRDHPLARGPLTIERWLAAEHLVVTGQTRGATIEDLALQKLGIERRVARRCQTYQVAGQFIAQSNLVAVVPAYYAELFGQSGSLVTREFAIATPDLEVALYWATTADGDPGGVWLRDLILEQIERLNVRRARRATKQH